MTNGEKIYMFLMNATYIHETASCVPMMANEVDSVDQLTPWEDLASDTVMFSLVTADRDRDTVCNITKGMLDEAKVEGSTISMRMMPADYTINLVAFFSVDPTVTTTFPKHI